MTGFGTLLRKEVLEQWRTLRLPIVGGLLLVVGIGSPLLAKYTPEIIEALAPDFGLAVPPPTTADAIDQLLRNLAQFGGLAAILLAMGSVAVEKDRGTAAFVLVKPAGRGAFLGAKVVALGLTLGISTALAVAAGWIYTAILFEPSSAGGFAALAALVWLSLLAYAAVTFLASTLTSSSLVAGGIGFAALLGLGILGVLPTVGAYLPPGLLGPAADLAMGQAPEAVVGPVLAVAGFIAGCVGLAWLAFRRQEL